uniref:C-type lectin domain-containing protein n=1 Tax=Amphiprion percula TaxID=161767 RepID=A0A3P8TCC5_AMPPE
MHRRVSAKDFCTFRTHHNISVFHQGGFSLKLISQNNFVLTCGDYFLRRDLLFCNLFKDGPCPKCEAGWEHHGGKCYNFTTNKSSWEESRSFCQSQGGDLVKIDSSDEQSFLERRLKDVMSEAEDKFWIGLTDSEEEGRWLWVDGSPLNERLKFWNYKEPDNWTGKDPNGEDCVRMGEKVGAPDLKCWFDKSCKVPHKSICEKPEKTGQRSYVCV